jgi:hypothetical protein
VRVVRYLLQALILVLGAAALLPAIFGPKADLLVALGVGACFAFLFFLTVLLREHTESRLVSGREVSSRLVARFLAFVGAGMCWLGVSVINGYQPGSHGRRRDILRLAIEHLGPWPPGLFFVLVGASVVRLACRKLW